MTKTIQHIVPPSALHWVGDGFRVNNFMPSQKGLSMQEMDPFLVLEYNALMQVPPLDKPRGVEVHPHRGFETVTIVYEGRVEHHDSAGGGGVIATGDVQWMTAGSGVLHKEYYERTWAKEGGPFQLVQLFVNLPARHKMNPPAYQAIESKSMGHYLLSDGKSEVVVVAGEYKGVKGPARTHSPMYVMNARLERGVSADFSFPAHFNTLVLVIKGSVRINSVEVPTDHAVKFANEGEEFSIEGLSPNSIALILSGEPLNEPIVAYGPFVMNTENEIRQAIKDYNMGKFGFLED